MSRISNRAFVYPICIIRGCCTTVWQVIDMTCFTNSHVCQHGTGAAIRHEMERFERTVHGVLRVLTTVRKLHWRRPYRPRAVGAMLTTTSCSLAVAWRESTVSARMYMVNSSFDCLLQITWDGHWRNRCRNPFLNFSCKSRCKVVKIGEKVTASK